MPCEPLPSDRRTRARSTLVLTLVVVFAGLGLTGYLACTGSSSRPPSTIVRELRKLPVTADDTSALGTPHRLHLGIGDSPISRREFVLLLDLLRDGARSFQSTDLVIQSRHVSSQDFSALLQTPNLRGLLLTGHEVDDSWIWHITAQSPALQSLTIVDTSVTETGISTLASLGSLRLLSIPSAQISIRTQRLLTASNPNLELLIDD